MAAGEHQPIARRAVLTGVVELHFVLTRLTDVEAPRRAVLVARPPAEDSRLLGQPQRRAGDDRLIGPQREAAIGRRRDRLGLFHGDHRQGQVRRVLGVVVDGLRRRLQLGTGAQRQARVLIARVPGKIAAGHLQPQAMPFAEQHAGLPQADPVAIHLVRFNRRGVLQRLAEGDAHDALGDVNRPAVGMHVGQRRREVGVDGRRGGVQRQLDRTGHLDVVGQRFRCVHQHVGTRLKGLAILRAPDVRMRGHLTAERRHGIGRIVHEPVRRLITRRRGRRQSPVAARGVRFPAAVQVVLGELRAGQRPFLLVAPPPRSHDVDADRRLAVDAILDALQPIVVPAQVRLVGRVGGAMDPATDADFRPFPHRRRATLLAEPREVAPILVDQVVVPAGSEVGRRTDQVVLVLDAV